MDQRSGAARQRRHGLNQTTMSGLQPDIVGYLNLRNINLGYVS
jgi:hypothetical protein